MKRERPRSYDLRQGLDERSWVNEHPVYCPASYCDAHEHRWSLCGINGEPLIGIHEGRIRAWSRFRARQQRFIQTMIDAGSTREEAEKTAAFAQYLRDGAECAAPRKP